MARIPLYQQGQLASSRTGVSPLDTPGVDTSGAQLGNSLAQSFGQVKNAVYGLASDIRQEEMVELRRKQAEQRAIEKELERQKQQTHVGAKASDLDVRASELKHKLQAQYYNDTTGAEKAFNEQFQAMAQETLDGETNELTKYQLQEKIGVLKSGYAKSMGEFVANRRLPIMEANVKQTAANFVTKVRNLDTTEPEVGESILTYHKDNIETYKTLYGGDAEETMRKDLEVGVRERLSAIANSNNPEKLKGALAAYDVVLDASDKQEFIAKLNQDAANKAKVLEQERKYDTAIKTYTLIDKVRTKAEEGTLTAGDVDQANREIIQMGGSPSATNSINSMYAAQNRRLQEEAKQAEAKKKRETAKERKISETNVKKSEADLFKQEGIPVRTDIQKRYDSLIAKKKGKVGYQAGVTPDQLSDLYADVQAAQIQGYITPSEAKFYGHNIGLALKVFDRKDPPGAAHARTLLIEADKIVKNAVKHSKDPEFNKLYGTKFMNDYIDSVQQLEQKQKKPATVEQRKQIMDFVQNQAIMDAKTELEERRRQREILIKRDMQKRKPAQ